MKEKIAVWLAVISAMALGATVITALTNTAGATGGNKAVCHPVNGNGETGYGWNIISPDHASSHIDEDTGAPKHEADGRVDVYVDSDGNCPGKPDECPEASERKTPTPFHTSNRTTGDDCEPTPTCETDPSPELCEQPPAKNGTDVSETVDCKSDVVTILSTAWFQPYVWDEVSLAWIPGQRVESRPVVTTRPATNEDCPKETCTP